MSNPRPGWLERQFASTVAEKKTWPAWMRRDYEGPPPPEIGLNLYGDPEHPEPEAAKILRAIQDSVNVALLPSWLKRA